jgi:hypothetical protein
MFQKIQCSHLLSKSSLPVYILPQHTTMKTLDLRYFVVLVFIFIKQWGFWYSSVMVICLMHKHWKVTEVSTHPLVFCPSSKISSSQQVVYWVENYNKPCFICVTCIMQSTSSQFSTSFAVFRVYDFGLPRHGPIYFFPTFWTFLSSHCNWENDLLQSYMFVTQPYFWERCPTWVLQSIFFFLILSFNLLHFHLRHFQSVRRGVLCHSLTSVLQVRAWLHHVARAVTRLKKVYTGHMPVPEHVRGLFK